MALVSKGGLVKLNRTKKAITIEKKHMIRSIKKMIHLGIFF